MLTLAPVSVTPGEAQQQVLCFHCSVISATLVPCCRHHSPVSLPGSTKEQVVQTHHLGTLTWELFHSPFQRKCKDTIRHIQLAALPWGWQQCPAALICKFRASNLMHQLHTYTMYEVVRQNAFFPLLPSKNQIKRSYAKFHQAPVTSSFVKQFDHSDSITKENQNVLHPFMTVCTGHLIPWAKQTLTCLGNTFWLIEMPLLRPSQSINWILLFQVKGLLFLIRFVNRLWVMRYMKEILCRPESYELSGGWII